MRNRDGGEHPLVGTWRLVSLESRDADGRVRYPYGHEVTGYLMYASDGYMNVAIMSANRPTFAEADILQGSVEELVAAARTYISYAGPFEVQEVKVIHHVEVSLFPNWIGGTQERFYDLSGDRLTLSTAPMLFGGTERRAYLIWERASGEE